MTKRVADGLFPLKLKLARSQGAKSGIFVMTPAGAISGGPEALHQLSDALNATGKNGYITYFPYPRAPIPEPFREYRITRGIPADLEGNTVVIPETETRQIRWFRKASVAVWWLSVDNFYGVPSTDAAFERAVEDHAARSTGRGGERATWDELRKAKHFTQSEYARRFLQERGIESHSLGDYINTSFYDPQAETQRRTKIAYNPAKGIAVTRRLMASFPSFEWLALKGLSREGLVDALRASRIFVDFGNHPGRDRIPREAVLQGACLIVGRRGAAGIYADLPIPDRYKLDVESETFEREFRSLVDEIMEDPKRSLDDLEEFRTAIERQKREFLSQVESLF